MMLRGWLVGSLIFATAGAQAQSLALGPVSKYHITDAERAACQEDAIALCSTAYPDEDRLLACMKLNMQQLTPRCLVTFEAGLKRRHISY